MPPRKKTAKKSVPDTAAVVSKIISDQENLHAPKRKRKSTPAASTLPKIPRLTHHMSASEDSDEPVSESDVEQSYDNNIAKTSTTKSAFASGLCDLINENTDNDSLSVNLADEDPDMIAIMNKCFKVLDESGPPVSQSLATKLQDQLARFAGEDDIKDMNTYLRPENIPLLAVPQLNSELFPKIMKHKPTRIMDFGLQKCQRQIIQSMVPVVHMMDDIIKGKFSKADIMEKLGDALRMQAFASTSLSYRRRLNFQPRMTHTYTRDLVSRSNPLTTFLFGDDVHKTVTEMKATESLAKEFSRSYNNKNKNWKNKGQNQGQGQGQTQNQNQGYHNKNDQSKNGGRGYKGKKPWPQGKKPDGKSNGKSNNQ